MNTSINDIVYENGNHWVLRTKKGTFEVYRISSTHSTRCAIIGYEGQKGLDRAKLECDLRVERER